MVTYIKYIVTVKQWSGFIYKSRNFDYSDFVEKIGSLSTLKITVIIEGVKLLIEPREVS